MAKSMRAVRKRLRQEMLIAIQKGEGNTERLLQIADQVIGGDVGYHLLVKTMCQNEVNNGLAKLRTEGQVESVGKKWKSIDSLEAEDVDIISSRRLTRLRGEMKAEIRLLHEHGRTEEAIAISEMLGIVTHQLNLFAAEDEPAKTADAVRGVGREA